MKRVVAIGMLLCCVASIAQQRAATFFLGIAHSQAWMRYGAPESFYVSGRHYKSLPSVGSGLVYEVYSRRSGANIYEARLLYQIDPDSSRLHPSSRLEEIHFIFDKPLAAKSALTALPEAVSMCPTGCAIFGYKGAPAEHLKLISRSAQGSPVALEASWVAADGITERDVSSLDDAVTEIWMYIPDTSEVTQWGVDTSGTLGIWPDRPHTK